MKHKVLHIHSSTILGGTQLRAFQVASGLKASYDLSVLFNCLSGSICDYYQKDGIPFRIIPFWRPIAAFHAIQQFKPDIVHLFGLRTNVFWRPILYSAGYRNLIGHIAGLTNTGEKPRWLRIHLDLWTLPFLKFYLSNSQRVADKLVNYGFPKNKLRVIHNGVAVPEMLPNKQQHDPPMILSVGMLRPVKGYRYLIEVLKLLHERGVRFKAQIIGEGPDQPYLERLIQQSNLEERIQLCGEIENKDLLSMMDGADVFALLSLSEGISGAAMEAMAYGIPVVATDVGGMGELIRDGVDGFLVPAKSVSQASDRLADLLIQPSLRQSLGEKAYQKVKSEFNLAHTVRDYDKLYNEN